MMAYDGPGGAMFKNNKKERDTHPDLTGFVELTDEVVRSINDQAADGVKYPKIEISGWSKVSSKGNKFISLSAKKPWEKNAGGSRGGSGGGSRGGYSRDDRRDNRGRDQRRTDDFNLDDEIPF
jgi:hypothetical protein